MEYIQELKEKLEKYIDVEVEDQLYQEVDVEEMTYLHLRDKLFTLGDILEEDADKQIYIVSIPVKKANSNLSTVAIKLMENKLYMLGSAQEGLINQRTCEKVFNKILSEKKNKPYNFKVMLAIGTIVIIGIIAVWFVMKQAAEEKINEAIEQTIEYNQAVVKYNAVAKKYNDLVEDTSIDNISGLPSDMGKLEVVSEERNDVAQSLKDGNSTEKIKLDIETLKDIIENGQLSYDMISQITNPSEAWVIERLSNVESVTGVGAVTEDNNPDGLLNKEGAYIACVYFTIEGMEQEGEETDIVAIGTDGGGAIEVYEDLEDAQARCEYLKSFDQTVLYSGSYALLGTMVVRTSFALTSDEQYALTEEITNELLKNSEEAE